MTDIYSKSLNELKEYQTTYTMHSREWYIINECIEIVHQHTADHIGDANKMVSSEIRDNDMDKIIGNLEREWRPAYNCGELSVGEFHMIRRVITAIRSHLRTTEPVSVSLEKCAEAVARRNRSIIVGSGIVRIDDCHRADAKAVLDAAGVKYVD